MIFLSPTKSTFFQHLELKAVNINYNLIQYKNDQQKNFKAPKKFFCLDVKNNSTIKNNFRVTIERHNRINIVNRILNTR